MEFEDNKPVSDDDRRFAEARKLTLQPVHADIAPEDLSDSEISNRHVLEPAIINMSNDTEQMATRVMPTKSLVDTKSTTKPQTFKLMVSIITGTVIFAGLSVFALLK